MNSVFFRARDGAFSARFGDDLEEDSAPTSASGSLSASVE